MDEDAINVELVLLILLWSMVVVSSAIRVLMRELLVSFLLVCVAAVFKATSKDQYIWTWNREVQMYNMNVSSEISFPASIRQS